MTTLLRQRMIDAMVLRGFRPRTQVSYLRAVSQMALHYHRSPDLITDQEVQAYLLHLVRDRQLARTSVNQVSCATRFLICEVLGQADRRSRIPMALTPQRLPEVLSRAEVAAVLAAPLSLKARTLLMTAYSTGLRVSELCNLRGCDIDSLVDVGPVQARRSVTEPTPPFKPCMRISRTRLTSGLSARSITQFSLFQEVFPGSGSSRAGGAVQGFRSSRDPSVGPGPAASSAPHA